MEGQPHFEGDLEDSNENDDEQEVVMVEEESD